MTSFAVRGDRSNAVQLFLGASIVAALIVILTASMQMRTPASNAIEAPVPTQNTYITSELPQLAVVEGGFSVGAQIAALILANALQFLTGFVLAVWVYRAYANLRHLGVRTTYTPFAAAAYVVVPLANLIVPHAVFDEIWRGSDPSGLKSVMRLPVRPMELVSKWWYLFIAYAVTSNIAASLLISRADPKTVQIALIVAAVAGIVAAIVGIDMIRLVDTRQMIRRGAQPRSAMTVAEPVEAPATSGWREAFLPVVTQVERQMHEEEAVAETVIALELEEPEHLPSDLARPRPGLVLVLLLFAAFFAFLQSLGALTNILETKMPRFAAFYLLLFPFAAPMYAIIIAIVITFSYWLNRTYGNLRAYMTPPRPHLDASTDFIRRGGDPEVLAELWAVTMSQSSTPSAAVVELWARAWRAMQISGALSIIGVFLLPARLALAIIAMFFALIGWCALLARRLVREISAEQTKRLDALAARQSRFDGTSETPAPPARPQ
ncbi:MAG TPA: DUF4328 domain-containing protein [Thermoanaerobaculia bacterium]|jgi:hypothetical protein|nr:DUF4328 domain-containing protein [Thermoanaerobaculia bacterium]